MSSPIAAMSNYYSPATRRPGFLRKLAVTFLFGLGITGFMALINVYQKNVSSFWMMIFAILGIGLACGAATRFSFYYWSGFIRFIVILLVLPAALFILGVLTNWQLGIGPLNPWAKGMIPQDELIQLGGAFLVAFISLEAWWTPPSKIKDNAEAPLSPRNREQASEIVANHPYQPRLAAQIPENLTFLPQRKSQLKFLKASKAHQTTNPAHEKLFLVQPAQPTRSRHKKIFNRKPNLHISRNEEHRCPFCLEEVKRRDPRGVKKCEVCNAYHHADCWAITGMCQVPHLNS